MPSNIAITLERVLQYEIDVFEWDDVRNTNRAEVWLLDEQGVRGENPIADLKFELGRWSIRNNHHNFGSIARIAQEELVRECPHGKHNG